MTKRFQSKENESVNEKTRKIQWHPAFFAALQLVFQNERAHLKFEAEHILNTKPLMADVLVLKKPGNYDLENSLGQIFKEHNIVEYKSPQDAMNVDTYFKIYGYTCLYKASGVHADEIKRENVTITMVRAVKPKELFAYFVKNHYQISNPFPGIYYVRKDGMFDTQIVIGNELQEREQIWIKAMTPNADENTLSLFLDETSAALEQGLRNLVDSVLEVVVAENQRSIKDLKGDADMCEALREIMKDEIEEAAQGGMETAQRNIALEMLRQEMADEKIVQITKLSKEILEELKKEL